jgi:hypothetical protein
MHGCRGITGGDEVQQQPMSDQEKLLIPSPFKSACDTEVFHPLNLHGQVLEEYCMM